MRTTEFTAIVDLLPEPLLLVSDAGIIRACNRAFEAMIGRERVTLIAHRLDSLTRETPEVVDEYLRACAGSTEALEGSVTLRRGSQWITHRSDGVSSPETRDCVLLRLIAKESMGAFTGDQVLPLDAERAREGELERRQRQTLEVTLRSMGEGVIVTDAHSRICLINAAAEFITGWSSAEAVGKPLHEVFRIFDEQTGAPIAGLTSQVLQTGGGIRHGRHTVLLTQNGGRVPLDDRAALICLPGGEPFGVVVVFRDLTKSKSAESAEALLASIIASADDAIVSKTLNGHITSWNIGASRLFGYTAEEMVGKPITTIIPPELHAEEQEIIRRIRNGEHIEHFETSRVAKNRQRVDVSLTVSPIRDETGTIIGASKIARDIGPRMRAEALLRETDRRKDQFLAMLSHELRNPLAPIRYAASLLTRNIHLTPEARAATEVINRQVRHLTHLVDDLLDVSRITTGRIRLKVELLDLVSVITLAIASYRPLLEADHIELSCDCPRGPLHVRGDRTRLAQVFSNLLGNAGKYTPGGGVVHLSVRRELSQVLVSIRDTGVGIPSEMLRQVFDLFTQVDSTYERIGGGGLGIGLTIAKRLVEMHHGQIEAHSEGSNRGTEFVVRLPIAEATEVLEPIEVPKEKTPVVVRRVLIADDNRDAADSLASILRVLGHDVRIAYDGFAALEVADEFHPDVVLLDIGMPRLDGYETVQRIATRSWAKGTLRVALTGWGQSSDRERARAAGFHRHLVKPVDPEVLTEILSQG